MTYWFSFSKNSSMKIINKCKNNKIENWKSDYKVFRADRCLHVRSVETWCLQEYSVVILGSTIYLVYLAIQCSVDRLKLTWNGSALANAAAVVVQLLGCYLPTTAAAEPVSIYFFCECECETTRTPSRIASGNSTHPAMGWSTVWTQFKHTKIKTYQFFSIFTFIEKVKYKNSNWLIIIKLLKYQIIINYQLYIEVSDVY